MSADILVGDPVLANADVAFTATPRMPAVPPAPRREFDTAEGAKNAETGRMEIVPEVARRPTAVAAALEDTILPCLALACLTGGGWGWG